MKIMVTGAAGYIGSIVARDLATEHEVVGVDMRPMPNVPDSRVMDLNSYEEIFDALDAPYIKRLDASLPADELLSRAIDLVTPHLE